MLLSTAPLLAAVNTTTGPLITPQLDSFRAPPAAAAAGGGGGSTYPDPLAASWLLGGLQAYAGDAQATAMQAAYAALQQQQGLFPGAEFYDPFFGYSGYAYLQDPAPTFTSAAISRTTAMLQAAPTSLLVPAPCLQPLQQSYPRA